MLRYLSNSQINYQLWDACVAESPQALLYGLSWYLDVVAPGWAALVAEEAGRYLTVMPLPEARKMGIPYLRQPFFAQQLGVFSVAEGAGGSEVLDKVLRQYALVSGYCFNTGNPDLALPADPYLELQQHYTHHLDLSSPYGTLYHQYSRDRKLNLGRARKAGLEVVAGTDIQPLIDMFQSDAAARIRGGVSDAAYRMLESLYLECRARGLAQLYYTRTAAGDWDAGCLFVAYAGKIIYLFNAATPAGRRRNGRSLMIDQVIRQHAGQRLVFDFESPAAVAPIIRVYQGFGARPVPFYAIRYNRLPAPVRWVKQARQLFYQKVLPTFKPDPKA